MSVIFMGWLLLGVIVVCFLGFSALAFYVAEDLERFHDRTQKPPAGVSQAQWDRVTRPWGDQPSQYRKVE